MKENVKTEEAVSVKTEETKEAAISVAYYEKTFY